jgi:hypothetical protein
MGDPIGGRDLAAYFNSTTVTPAPPSLSDPPR